MPAVLSQGGSGQHHVAVDEHVLAVDPGPVGGFADGAVALPAGEDAVDDRPGGDDGRDEDEGQVPVEGGELRVVERGAAPEPDDELDAVGEPPAQLLLVALVEPLGVDRSKGLPGQVGTRRGPGAGGGHDSVGGPVPALAAQQAAAAADVDVGRGPGPGAVVPAAVFHGCLLGE